MKVVVLGGAGVAGRHVVEALRRKGADAVPASRRNGVDLATGAGLREALAGAQRVIDVSSDASPDEATARAFFTISARHLQREAVRGGETGPGAGRPVGGGPGFCRAVDAVL